MSEEEALEGTIEEVLDRNADRESSEDEAATEGPPLGAAGEKALEAFKERARRSEAKAKAFDDRDREAKALAAKVKEFEDKDKSEQEKLAERTEAAEKRVQEAEAKAAETELRLTRRDAAQKHKLPVELADRIQGSTEDEIDADAERLSAHLKPQAATDFDGGPRKSVKAPDRDSLVLLAKENPAEFNRRMDAGEISSGSLTV